MRSAGMRMALSGVITLLAVSTAAADSAYFSVKGGAFMPSGKEHGTANSLKSFDTGYAAELAFGYRPESYAALELGTGVYSASGTVTDAVARSEKTLYGVPVTLTAKAILELEKLELFAGAGAGYYFTFIDQKLSFTNGGIAPVDESSHGSALGYHLVAGGDLKLSENFRLGADFKWFSVKPDLELTDAQNVKKSSNWDLGGTTVSLGFKYLY